MAADDADQVMPQGVKGFTFIDDVPEVGNPVITDADALACVTCGTPLEYSGRGPKPKYCADHKRGKGSTRIAGGNSGANVALINRAIAQMEAGYRMLAAGVKLVDGPETASQIDEHSEELAESWRTMLEVNKKFRDAFSKIEQKSAWLPVIMAHGDMAASILMSRQLRKVLDQAAANERNRASGEGDV